jgi:hypothetical protein
MPACLPAGHIVKFYKCALAQKFPKMFRRKNFNLSTTLSMPELPAGYASRTMQRRQAGTLMLLSALFPKGKRMSYYPQSAPDFVFLRNTGMALLALAVAAGAISVIGALKTSEPLVLAQSVDFDAPATGLMLMQPERNISRPEK